MNEIAIQVRGLGKRYPLHRSAGAKSGYRTLREDLSALPKRLWSTFRAEPGRDEIRALRDLSFEVRRGEVLGVIGRNGSGKSTLLKILSRIIEPTSGEVDIYGRVGSLLEVGTGFHPELTGRENIYLSGAILGMRRPEIHARFDEIVAFAGVERFVDEAVKHYSSGMHARLAFAVAAHLETDILLLDEVLAVGDAEFQRRCLGKVGEVARSGRTVLFVSHHMAAVRQFCSAGLVLDGGELHWCGTDVAEAVARYHTLTQGGSGPASEWRSGADGDDCFTLRALRLVDADGQLVVGVCGPQQRVWLEVEWESRRLHPGLSIGYALRADTDEVLYWSFHTDDAPNAWPETRIGTNRLRTELPRDALNEGTYRLELMTSLHPERWIYPPAGGGPGVSLTVSGLPGKSPLWSVRRPGFLAPLYPWRA